ncbi:MAG: TRAP transporter substrate-binding protein, partial [Alphaproteobacteria bacterium]
MPNRNVKGPLFAAIGAAAIIGGSFFTAPASAETTLLFNRFVPAKHPFNVGMFIPWAKDVERVTNGSVKVKFTEKSLAPPPKQWNMVSKGIADVAMLANNFESGRLKLPNIAQLPFGHDEAEKRSIALWRTHQEYFGKAGEYKGMKLLGLWTISGANFLTDKPINSLEDLKNYKMWAINGIPNRMMKSLGAVVVSVPGVQMFNVVSKGVVKGSVTSYYTLNTFKLMPYIKNITVIPGGFNSNNFSLLLNEDKWNGLTDAERKAITSISAETIAVNAGKRIDLLDANAKKQALEKGIKIQTASPAFVTAMSEKLQFVTDDWVKEAAGRGVDGKAAIA